MAKRPAFPCPCCGYIVFDEPPGSYGICDICFWEDDPVQLRWANFEGGANRPSLIQAQMTYAAIGVSEPRFKANVRAATAADIRDVAWRRFDPANDYVPPPGAPWPHDRISYYWTPGPDERH